jgi:lanosterol synthase
VREHPDLAGLATPLEKQRIFDAVDTILSLRDTRFGSGGWASYEEPRAPVYLELLNCAEVFKDIMVDYIYAECTSSCVHSLVLFRRQFPEYRTTAVNTAIRDGVRVVKQKQRADGSWYGSWGVCFTYGAWLTTEALVLAGEDPATSGTLRKCCEFLLSKQRTDGGWGEDFNACVTSEWVENPDGSQVVNTAWAAMALMAAGGARHFRAVERGIRFIMSRQLKSGDWKQERISGVFNGNCAIHYPGYKNCMPVWALAKYEALLLTLPKTQDAAESS